ncbi:vesicle-associated 1-2 [Olea europaea subsp. europaea]|uniref:Vesicle-associated 1-2 n=1 Tax=Olea europaea subsp. europaea TaxID=158383 RepID=A0A8S0Q2B2_OLEEU|nr:vesicle-associated 1-2 [Olea europaea subsp. europaea]
MFDIRKGMSTEQLLDIEPSGLSFPFELRRVRRQVSCIIRLSNKTRDRVAFMVVNPNPLNYGCEPNLGILSPRSTCDLTVTMQALEEAPRNMECENNFLIRSLIVSSGATKGDVEILFDEEGHRSQNGLLNADYIFPPQVKSVVPDGIVAWLIIAVLAITFWYLMKKTLLLIWSSIFLFIMLMIKIISQSALDAIKDWISGTLRDIFFDPLYRRLQDIVHGFEPIRERQR